MKLVVQCVTNASVEVEGHIVGKIKRGFMVLVGIGQEDTEADVDFFTRKLLNLRVFADENGKTNLSLKDIGGELLLISQFTLYADCRRGNRPGFTNAGDPVKAKALYEYMIDKCREQVPVVEKGVFGAHMKVSLVNDGPFTIILDESIQKK